MKNKMLTPRFIVAVLIIGGSAASLQAMIGLLEWSLIKEPIYLRRPLELIPASFGPYQIHERQQRLSSAMEDELGTTNYISWVYRDTRKQNDDPGAFVRVHIPYYTGTIDTVPHVPDRCFVAGGAARTGLTLETIDLDNPRITRTTDGEVRAMTAAGKLVALPDDQAPATVVIFTNAETNQNYGVSYLFIVNDTFTATPEGVRLKAFNLTDRYAYHCKVEVMPFGAQTPEQTRELSAEFLSYLMPEVFLCLPDWEAANAAPRTEVAGK